MRFCGMTPPASPPTTISQPSAFHQAGRQAGEGVEREGGSERETKETKAVSWVSRGNREEVTYKWRNAPVRKRGGKQGPKLRLKTEAQMLQSWS